jgi:hypothetical protein
MVGSDDLHELVQDGLVMALQLYRRANQNQKKVSPANLVYYTVRHLRVGRRSTGQRQRDPLAPACQLSGRSQVCSLDCPVDDGEHGLEPLTLHDYLADQREDPALAAARRLDWQIVIRSLDRTTKAILSALAQGRDLTHLVKRLKRSDSSLHSAKCRLGRRILEKLGPDILLQAQARPSWVSDLNAVCERLTCRAQRRVVA